MPSRAAIDPKPLKKGASPPGPAPETAASAAQKTQPPKSPAQKALEKMGLRRDIDLALHLPLRYEDETRIVRLADARDGDMVQIEGQITHSEITFRGRRQLRVTIDDGTDTCVLRFINFYPSHQKTLSVGRRCGCAVKFAVVSSAAKWFTPASSWLVANCRVR